MRAARIEAGVVVDLWEVPGLDCYPDLALIEAPAEAGIGWGYTPANGFRTPSVPIAEARSTAVARVKATAGAVIINRYPDWKQRNMTARAVALVATATASGAELDALSAAWDWISAVRLESDRVEAAIQAADTQTGIDAALASATWPA